MDDVWIKASIDLRLQQSWPEDAAAWNSGNVHQAGKVANTSAELGYTRVLSTFEQYDMNRSVHPLP